MKGWMAIMKVIESGQKEKKPNVHKILKKKKTKWMKKEIRIMGL